MTHDDELNEHDGSADDLRRILRLHLRDIRHLVAYGRRIGEDPETMATWLEAAAEELRELASDTTPRRTGQNPVSILA